VTQTQDLLTSAVPDVGDVPLSDPLEVDDDSYARIMRRIGLAEGDPGPAVSAFNSSI